MGDGRNGNQQYYGNRNGGGFQKNSFEDKSETPNPVKITSFYKADGKTVQEDLFDSVALNVAKSFKGKNIGVTSTQLRRIFDEVKRFEQILSLQENQWEKQLPYIKMIKSKVAYSVARAAKQKSEEKGVYKNLEAFISSGIDLIKTQEDYHIFVNLFEAAYGFYYELAPSNCR
ncbi:type III-A CRISPR-associated protein Csm2 [Treponema succinifaciens]|uniref:CRISPR system Cms protein Csm2 n=1 Tax=Treponema succinifaciens (strain ATCC 33096 / DSM 2489 / 6091) TaxID=869209 RepID=F2NWD8_TRES6|nr:type III-A CRISPR-associated protein Csm2 [Treponema succinifaciens]AEB15059.1 CRISPR-associated protein TM1810 domain protein [Treponema succinifaciens DSM 2489]